MEAQLIASPAGEYYLSGVPETACGFKLTEDHYFQFFFSQGALDRFGEGTWEIKDGRILLNSRPRPEHDFSMSSSGQSGKPGIEIQITDSNMILQRYVFARIHGGGKVQESMADDTGQIHFEPQAIDSLELIFQFCPEKTSVFRNLPTNHNRFEFGFENWLLEVFFKNFALVSEEGKLSGANPVLQGTQFKYKKASD